MWTSSVSPAPDVFVELIEHLRCPRPHEESPLVVAASRTQARHIMDGVLGCPVCNAEFAIVDGVARFAERARTARADAPSDEEAMRLAAFLQLTDARGAAVLTGRFASQAAGVSAMAEAPLVLVNAPAGATTDVAASLEVGEVFPFVAATLRAAAIDESATPALAQSIVRAVRGGGRVLGAAAVPMPDGLTEIVRDDRVWVAEKSAASESATPRLVSLSRAPKV